MLLFLEVLRAIKSNKTFFAKVFFISFQLIGALSFIMTLVSKHGSQINHTLMHV